MVALPALLAARARALFPDPEALAGPVLGSLLAELLPHALELALLDGLAGAVAFAATALVARR